MTTDVIKLYAKYNSHANNEMNKYISKLNEIEWAKEFGGYYKSIKSVCSHIYIGDFNWLKRFGILKPFDFLKNSIFNNSYLWDSIIFTTIEEYIKKRDELDLIFKSFAEEIKQEDLSKNIKYKNFKGEDQDRNFGGLLLHVFNHQTHHRGMISLYLELLGKNNDFSNLLVLV